jgi:spore coat protein A, manganese oxidase
LPRCGDDSGGGPADAGPDGASTDGALADAAPADAGVDAFVGPVALPIPPVKPPTSSDATTDYYTIVMQQAAAQLRAGAATMLWTYDGIWPGPTIRARSGRTAVVRFQNDLTQGMSIHLHGARVAPESDGHPTDLIAPGSFKDYTYPNEQLAATLWYHDHAMDLTGPHVYRGLAGMYLISDDVEDALDLPAGDQDIPLVLQDRTLTGTNTLLYDPALFVMSGFLGDISFVNGAIRPYLQVATVRYRFRILNGSNARVYDLSLGGGASFVQIGSDGALLPEPVTRASIALAPAERVEVVVDFAGRSIGSSIQLLDGADELMRFDVTREETDASSPVPSVLRPITRHVEGDATRTRTFTLQFSDADGHWLINGLAFDASRVDANPALDDLEIWELVNPSTIMHPFHIHLVQFQVLDVAGAAPPPELMGWKDTVQVPAGQTVRVIARFSGYRGRYVMHCHILEHEDHMMMAQFEVV